MLTRYTIEGFENIQYQGYHALRLIEERLSRLFHSYGYRQVATPTFEAYDFLASEDAIPSDDLFKLVNHQGKVLALKPDATLPIARMAAINHHDPDEIIKFCYLTNIYRNFASPDIVKKEITQMGVEYFGNKRPECDGEIIALAIRSLLENGIEDIHIDVGHVGFINHLFDAIRLTGSKRSTLLKLIETKNLGDISDFLTDEPYSKAVKRIILHLPRLYGEPREVLAQMEDLCIDTAMEAVVSQLRAIYKHLEDIGLASYVSFDIGFTSQMNYYSDLIFKAYINNWGEPVIGGGRYDTLSRKFGIDRPACGFGIDILKIMDYLEQNDQLPPDDIRRTIILYAPSDKAAAFEAAEDLRRSGRPAELFVVESTWQKVMARLLLNQTYRDSRYFYAAGGRFSRIDGDALIPADAPLETEERPVN